MLVSAEECEAYLANVAGLLERYGVVLTAPGPGADLELLEDDDGALSFEIIGQLPGETATTGAIVEVREELSPLGDGTHRTTRYEYELIDPAANHRRAFHLHDPETFVRRYLVAVHEHCEHPLHRVDCPHYAGSPLKDSHAGVGALMDAWVGGPIECSSLTCLE
jgi:hypothetical protein